MPVQPLTLLEMDIKMIWVEERQRYAFVLTILDTFTRMALYWEVAYRMQWEAIRKAWQWVFEHHLQPADMLAKGLEIEVRSENGHVESFHAILSTALRHEHFWTLQQLEARLLLFYHKYNQQRVHSSIAYLPPMIFWQAWQLGLIQTRQGKRKKTIFLLKVPRYQLLGYLKLEGASHSDSDRLDADPNQVQEVNGAVTLQPSV